MVTKQELLGTIKVPTELPLSAFIAARNRGCGAMYCLRCGSVRLLPPQSLGGYLGIIQSFIEIDGEEWDKDSVNYDRLYLTRQQCDQCSEEELDARELSFAHVSLEEDTDVDDSDSIENSSEGNHETN